MARAWIVDLWVKDAILTDASGKSYKIVASPAQLKSIKTLPDQFRSSRYGRGKRWKVVWHESGKQRSKLFETKKEAEALRAELEDDIRSGRYIDPAHADRQFSELAEVWLNSKGKIKDATFRRYKRDLDTYVFPEMGQQTYWFYLARRD